MSSFATARPPAFFASEKSLSRRRAERGVGRANKRDVLKGKKKAPDRQPKWPDPWENGIPRICSGCRERKAIALQLSTGVEVRWKVWIRRDFHKDVHDLSVSWV